MIYSSDGDVFDSEVHHQLDMPQEVAEAGPVTSKKERQPSKAEAESMTHQPEASPDVVQKTIRATIQHFRNAFMQGPELMRDFMEGKTSSEDESAIIRAMNVGWKTTPIAPRGLPVKLIDVEPEGSAALAEQLENDPQVPHALMHLQGNLEVMKDFPVSKNVEYRGDYGAFDKFTHHPLVEELKDELGQRGGTNIKDNTSRLGHQLGRDEIPRVMEEAATRTKLREFGKRLLKELRNDPTLGGIW